MTITDFCKFLEMIYIVDYNLLRQAHPETIQRQPCALGAPPGGGGAVNERILQRSPPITRYLKGQYGWNFYFHNLNLNLRYLVPYIISYLGHVIPGLFATPGSYVLDKKKIGITCPSNRSPWNTIHQPIYIYIYMYIVF